MASEVGICNAALDKLGAKRIASLSDDSRNARAMNAAYERIRDAELRKHRWGFAIRRASLAANSTEPEFGPANAYDVPTDFLRLIRPDPFRNSTEVDAVIEGRQILSDWDAPLEIRYIAKITDPNTMDALFRDALACALAFECCEEITQSNTKKESARVDYKAVIAEAKRANAIESVPAEPPEDPWITARL